MISPLFTTIVLCSAFIWIYMKATTNKIGSSTEELLDRERRANAVRRQSLDSLAYITLTDNDIPHIEHIPNDRIAGLIDTLNSLTNAKIVNLTGISNTDLKLMYGPSNLPALTQYDQNYTLLARTVYDLGMELYAEGLTDFAKSVFEYGIKIGTDISGNYIALANIYVESGDFAKVDNLITSAESIKSLTKTSTIAKLQEISDTHTTRVIVHQSDVSATDDNFSPDDPRNILPADILDILETVPYKSDDQM